MQRRSGKRGSDRGILPLFAGFLLLGGLVAVTAWLAFDRTAAVASVRQTLEVQTDLAQAFSLLLQAESGERRYLLTEQEEDLAQYRAAILGLDAALETLGRRTAGNDRQQQALATLRLAVEERLSQLHAVIERHRSGARDEARAMVRGDAGRTTLERVRDVVARMQAEESRLLALHQEAAWDAGFWVVMGTGGVALLVLALGVHAVADARRRGRAAEEARDGQLAANRRLMEEIAERERLEDRLRQSQKMEAIGQLTGGIAHDFNNMLAIVVGNLNLLRRRLARGETDLDRFAAAALDGADRAATLTHRLLAFSRRQPLAPEPLDANRFVAGMSDLLRRTLGAGIHLETVLAGGLWRTHADPSQLENAILNLAVNARDAMPESGGRLTIETANASLDEAYAAENPEVRPGQYVMVAVTDTGAGMPPEIAARAFDPFFTTKGPGKGTGLGLSQIYGFVKQSGGHVKIYSEPGQGTTVKLYLPRFLGAEDAAVAAALPQRAPRRAADAALAMGTAREVVLVVEDEERVRQYVVVALRELGYTVLEAEGAAPALRLLDAHPEVMLLLTDIVMPEVNGRRLAEEAERRRPGLKVLYTTGYTRNAVVHNGVLDPGTNFLGKPFTLEQLAAKVREVLGPPVPAG